MSSLHPDLEEFSAKNLIFVASTGGHLEQAVRWSDRLEAASTSLFITFDSPQSEGLLRNRRRTYIRYIPPRSLLRIFQTVPSVFRAIIRESDADAVLSTGAAIALVAYLPARLRRVPYLYVESFSRFRGPSLSGNILSRLPGVTVFTQHKSYGSRWRYTPSVLSDYRVVEQSGSKPGGSGLQSGRRVFVTLGTIRPYRFDALVDRILTLLEPNDDICWQLGQTWRSDLPGEVFNVVQSSEFDKLATAADVVVSHAGVGSLMRLLDLGVSPIAVPRLAIRNEHVDDHQLQAATALAELGLVEMMSADSIPREAIDRPRPTIVPPSI